MIIELFSKYADAVGIVGVIILLTAYFLISMNKITALSLSYPLMNFFGSLFILFSLMFKWNLASVFIEIAWALISTIGIYRAWRAARRTENFDNVYSIKRGKKRNTPSNI